MEKLANQRCVLHLFFIFCFGTLSFICMINSFIFQKYKLIDEKLCCIACLQQCNWQSQPWLHIKICKYEKVEGIWRCKACHTVCEIPSSHADNCPMQDISSSSPKKPARIKTAKQTSKGPIRSLTSKLENSGSVSVIDAKGIFLLFIFRQF